MQRRLIIPLLALVVMQSKIIAADRPVEPGNGVVLGDCGAVLDASKRVDVDRTIDALVAMHMNTFAYSMQESPTAWEQLPQFADAAAKHGINVWIYLAPWTEVPPLRPGKMACEPYRLDFIAWAQHTAELSKQHPNITAILIDDFAPNDTQPDRFTPDYTRAMKRAAVAGNPQLKIYAILYFDQAWADFVDRFSALVDGAVVCYPSSQEEIDSAANYLSGGPHGAAIVVDMGAHNVGKSSTTGMVATVSPPNGHGIRFLFDDASISQSTGEHTAFVSLNGRVVWSRRIADRCRDEVVDIPFPPTRSPSVQVALGVTGHYLGEKSEYITRFDDVVILQGGKPAPTQPRWRLSDPASVAATVAQAGKGTGNRVPMFLMPAAAPFEYTRRYNPPVTPASIGAKIELCLNNVRQQKSVGVVNFCTPKDPSDPILQLVAKLFAPQSRSDLDARPALR
jgi:hypothetical protein